MYDQATNVVINVTNDSRLCTKRPQLIKTRTSPKIFYVAFRFEAAVEIVAATLHPLNDCTACGVDVCQTMELGIVEDSFVTDKVVGTPFNCAMLPGPRLLQYTSAQSRLNNSSSSNGGSRGGSSGGVSEREGNGLLFQPNPGSLEVFKVAAETCDECPGSLCLNVVDISLEYRSSLVISDVLYICSMATGITGPPF